MEVEIKKDKRPLIWLNSLKTDDVFRLPYEPAEYYIYLHNKYKNTEHLVLHLKSNCLLLMHNSEVYKYNTKIIIER